MSLNPNIDLTRARNAACPLCYGPLRAPHPANEGDAASIKITSLIHRPKLADDPQCLAHRICMMTSFLKTGGNLRSMRAENGHELLLLTMKCPLCPHELTFDKQAAATGLSEEMVIARKQAQIQLTLARRHEHPPAELRAWQKLALFVVCAVIHTVVRNFWGGNRI